MSWHPATVYACLCNGPAPELGRISILHVYPDGIKKADGLIIGALRPFLQVGQREAEAGRQAFENILLLQGGCLIWRFWLRESGEEEGLLRHQPR